MHLRRLHAHTVFLCALCVFNLVLLFQSNCIESRHIQSLTRKIAVFRDRATFSVRGLMLNCHWIDWTRTLSERCWKIIPVKPLGLSWVIRLHLLSGLCYRQVAWNLNDMARNQAWRVRIKYSDFCCIYIGHHVFCLSYVPQLLRKEILKSLKYSLNTTGFII